MEDKLVVLYDVFKYIANSSEYEKDRLHRIQKIELKIVVYF